MKIKLFLSLLLFSISIISCTKNSKIKDIENKLSNGHYELSHTFSQNNENIIIPTPPDEIIISKDSVFYFEYEPYIPRKNGIINSQYFIFDKKDSVKFESFNGAFRTYTDTVVNVWSLIDKQSH